MPKFKLIGRRLSAIVKPRLEQGSTVVIIPAKAPTESSFINAVSSQPPNADLCYTAHFNALEPSQQPLYTVERLSIPVSREFVRGFLHLPPSYSAQNAERVAAAAILCSGAGGGVAGPCGSYITIGDKLATLNHGVPVLRVDYRYPADTKPCSEDVVAAMDYLENTYSISKFVLVGWSFGGAPVFTVAANEKERVIACATIASQTRAAGGIRQLSPRPVLLLHGTDDTTLSPQCSRSLYNAYGAQGDRTLKLFPGDDHSLRASSHEAEALLCRFIARCIGIEVDEEQRQLLDKSLIDDEEKVGLMKKGGDLDGQECVF
ncbi:uncharacterized protein A1O9_09338 [Exophiala aquamarina CBS 119918]|uniref:AB hydrolase-1 domain-containing protein n=1 Tax=Exophiala aquamarina CBS 119918 TaxID=1182545 RepID=A0A072PH97_9EURO|nr:uncharacterized protein A1O9_09338 [Exophiala aquamarina CBS 119918]KEF54895.1 hypothetical protein A1O9_09338 [Exophiala aquamarina CBS 119918]